MTRAILLLVCLLVSSGGATAEPPSPAPARHAVATGPFRFTVLHTSDLHSSIEGLGPDRLFTAATGDSDPVHGHFARLAWAIRAARAEKQAAGEPLLLVDSGDSLFGTLFHILGPSTASAMLPEWTFFRELGYDAVGLGNHDFESTERGLVTMLRKASEQSFDLPLVCGNLVPDRGNIGPDAEAAAFKAFRETRRVDGRGTRISRLLIRDLAHAGRKVRVGILGLVGPDAARVCFANRRFSGFTGFDDGRTKMDSGPFHDLAREQVAELRAGYGCDLVVVLFHGGTPEDAELVQNVPGIDLLIAGHTHEHYLRQEGATVIAQAGWGGSWLGRLECSWADGRLTLLNPATFSVAIDDAIPADEAVLAEIARYKQEIDRLRAGASFTYATPLFMNHSDLTRRPWPENTAGVFVATTLRAELNRRISTPVDLYLLAYGMVRSDFQTHHQVPVLYQFSDIFRFLPLGFDEAMNPGTPVVTFYLTPGDLGKLLEAMAGLSGSTIAYEPVPSNQLSFRFSSWGIPFVSRIADLQLDGKPLNERTAPVHVGTNEFFARNLARIETLSHGLIVVHPRDGAGNLIATLTPIPGLKEVDLLAAGLWERDRNASWAADPASATTAPTAATQQEAATGTSAASAPSPTSSPSAEIPCR